LLEKVISGLLLLLLITSMPVFTILYLKHTTFLGYSIVTIYGTCNDISHVEYFVLLYQYSSKYVRVQCPVWMFGAVPWCRVFPVRCSDIF
jgi:hypothetical protein